MNTKGVHITIRERGSSSRRYFRRTGCWRNKEVSNNDRFLQWAVSLGRFDIQTATMTMSGFREAQKQGHLDRLKRMYGYLKKYESAAIRVRLDKPDFSELQESYWCETVYGKVEELLPTDAPKPLGKATTTENFRMICWQGEQ
jgi:hypothetical protein